MEDENALIDQAKQGDEKAFTTLYNRYYGLIRYIIYDLVKDVDLTTDLVQTTFAKAFQKITSFVDPISFKAWLKTIAVNTVIDHVRATKDEQKETSIDSEECAIQLSDDTTPESEIIRLESIDILRQALQMMRSKYRSMLELRYFNNLSYDEISAELGVPIGTLKSDLNKAKKRLKKYYQQISNTT